jgi:predicted lipid-binding transport protein (Tim44 family)
VNKFLSIVLTLVLTLGALNAEAARRLGGGKSMGQQSGNVTQREAVKPSAPATPAAPSQAAAPAKPAAPAAAPAPAPAKRPWGAMLGGLAAGLGLAWLAHSLGMGEAFGNMLMFALLAMVAVGVIGYFLRSRKGAASGQQGGLAYQGAGQSPDAPVTLRQYNPEKVGNDASARPWEGQQTAFDSTPEANAQSGGSMIGSAIGGSVPTALQGSQAWGVPEGFDSENFVAAAKRNFITLQDAWDRADMGSLRAMMTDGMLSEIKSQLAEREANFPGQPNKTEVVKLEAQLLGIEELPDVYMASVEFNGVIREEADAAPSPFREVWNMTKPKNGDSGWLVAGVQALQ